MAGLLDIAPASEIVQVRGVDCEARGLSVRFIAEILAAFPVLRKLMDRVEIDAGAIVDTCADAVPMILAAGTGLGGNAQAIANAESLSISEQLDLLEPILRLTMPGGAGPLVEKVNKILNAAAP